MDVSFGTIWHDLGSHRSIPAGSRGDLGTGAGLHIRGIRRPRGAARRRLVGYQVPRAVVLLPALPRTPAGKLEPARVRGIASDAISASESTATGIGSAPGVSG
jgi:hypothetical protein